MANPADNPTHGKLWQSIAAVMVTEKCNVGWMVMVPSPDAEGS